MTSLSELRDIDLSELRELAAAIDEYTPEEASAYGVGIVRDLVAAADAEPDPQKRARLQKWNLLVGAMFYRRCCGDPAMPPWASRPPLPN